MSGESFVLVVMSTGDNGPVTTAIGPMGEREMMATRSSLFDRKLISSAEAIQVRNAKSWQTWRSKFGKE